MLLVEQNVAVSLKISAHAYVLENGRVSSRETITEAQALALMSGKDVIHRVQNRSTGSISSAAASSAGSRRTTWRAPRATRIIA